MDGLLRIPRAAIGALGAIWKTSHAPEYVGMVFLIACWQALRWFVRPYHQLYFVNDPRIAFPFAEHEQVTNCGFSMSSSKKKILCSPTSISS
jgi:hypothetical protein